MKSNKNRPTRFYVSLIVLISLIFVFQKVEAFEYKPEYNLNPILKSGNEIFNRLNARFVPASDIQPFVSRPAGISGGNLIKIGQAIVAAGQTAAKTANYLADKLSLSLENKNSSYAAAAAEQAQNVAVAPPVSIDQEKIIGIFNEVVGGVRGFFGQKLVSIPEKKEIGPQPLSPTLQILTEEQKKNLKDIGAKAAAAAKQAAKAVFEAVKPKSEMETTAEKVSSVPVIDIAEEQEKLKEEVAAAKEKATDFFNQRFIEEPGKMSVWPISPAVAREQRQKMAEDIRNFFNNLGGFFTKEEIIAQPEEGTLIDEGTINLLAAKISAKLPQVQQLLKETRVEKETQTKETQIFIDEKKVQAVAGALEQLKQKQAQDRQDLFNAISLTGRINNISNVTITNPTFSSGAITDADIPDTITASNYLALSGGTLTGNFLANAASSTITNLTVVNATSTNATTTTLYVSGNVGIGTTSPSEQFAVANRIYVGGSGTSTIENNLQVRGQLKVGTSSTYISGTEINATENFTIRTLSDNNHLVLQSLGRVGVSSSTPWGVLSVERNGANALMPIFVVAEQGTSSPYFIVNALGRVGIGTTTPGSLFSIQGNALFSGNLSVANLIATGTTRFNGTTYTWPSTGGSASQALLTDGAGTLSWGQGGELANWNKQSNFGVLTLTPTTTIPIWIKDAIYASSTLTVNGPANFNSISATSTLNITGLSTLTGGLLSTASSTFSSNLHVSGPLSASSTLLVANLSTLTGGFISQASSTVIGNFIVSGGLNASSTLTVAGNSIFYSNVGIGTTSPGALLAVQGTGLFTGTLTAPNIIATGTLNVTGVTTLTNASTTGMLTIGNGFISQASSTISNSLHISGALQASSTVSLSETTMANATTTFLAVTGNASTSQLVVSNSATLNTLTGNGLFTLNSGLLSTASSTFSSNLNVSGPLSASSTLLVANLSTLSGGFVSQASSTVIGNFIVTGGLNASSTLTVAGNSIFYSNVGIGTTSPGALLAVQGTGLFTGTLTAPNIIATGTLNVSGVTTLSNASTTGMLTIGNGFISSASSTVAGSLQIAGNLQASSTVSLATTTITANHASGSPAIPLTLFNTQSATNTANRLAFQISGATSTLTTSAITSQLVQNYDPGKGLLAFSVLNSGLLSEAARFDSNGFLGIGTTSPGALLAVQGDALIAGTTTVRALVATSSSLTVGGSNFVVGGSGNVGIGTAGPTAKMQVVTSGTDSSSVTTFDNRHFTVGLAGNSGATVLAYNSAGSYGALYALIPNSAWKNIAISPYGGSTSVGGDPTVNKFIVYGNTIIGSGYSAATAPTDGLLVQGGIGIATTSPGALLAVQGNALFSGNLNVANITATGTLNVTGVTTLTNASTTGMLTVGNGFISQASSTISNSLQIAGLLQASSSLSVGGGTALGSTLSVTGTSTLAGLSAGFGTFSSNLVTSGSLSATNLATLSGGLLSTASSTVIGNFIVTGGLNASSTLTVAGNSIFYSNVGIGTTSPGALLAVQGDALFSGNLNVANIIGTGTISVTGTTGTSTIGSITVGPNGRIGIGTTTPNLANFEVATRTIAFNSGADADLGIWATSTNTFATKTQHSSVTANGYIYVLGGADGAVTNAAQYAKLNSDGTVGSWATSTNTFAARTDHSSVAANGYVYVLGGGLPDGISITNSVQYAKLNSDGTVGTWATSTNSFAAREEHSSVAANGYVYVLGGLDGSGARTNTAQYAKLNSDGTVGSWATSTNSFATRFRHSSVTANGYVYVLGGYNGSAATTNTAQYAKLNSDGTVGSWATSTNTFAARVDHSSVAANGYVYVLGGYDGSGKVTNTVQYAKLNSDGTVGSWATSTNTFAARYDHSSVTANGYVYVLGGNNGAGTRTNTVQYASTARILVSGNLDLLGLASTTLGDVNSSDFGSVGGSIFAGNIFSAGQLEVTGNANFWNGMGINGVFSLRASTSLAQDVPIFSIQNATGTSPILTALYNGNLGIGTANPSYGKLHVNVGTDQIFVFRSSSNVARIETVNDAVSDNVPMEFVATRYSFVTGNVGIGTTTPNWLLQVAGTRPSIAISDTGAGGTNLKHWLFSSMGGNLYIGTTTDAYGTSTPPAITVTNSGNLGIGTASPTYLLDISGNFRANGIWTNAGITYWGNPATPTAYGILTWDTGYASIYANSGNVLKLGANGTQGTMIINSGNVGIGTTSPAQLLAVAGDVYIHNGATQENLRVNNGAVCADNNGATKCNAALTAGASYFDSENVGASDLAENYPVKDESIEAGDIVALTSDISASQNQEKERFKDKAEKENSREAEHVQEMLSTTLVKATPETSYKIIGAISTNPGITLGDTTGMTLDTETRPVALSGRIPVKVNLEGGMIAVGDPITISSVPGVGKKANQSGKIIGYALENYNDLTKENGGKILAFTSVGYWLGPDILNATSTNSSLALSQSNGLLAQVVDTVKAWLESMKVFIGDGLVRLKNLVAEKITTQTLCVEDVCVDKAGLQALLLNAGINSLSATSTTAIPASSASAPSADTATTSVSSSSTPLLLIGADDTEPPIITLIGESAITIEKGISWVDPGATVTDNVNDNLGIYYKVDGVETGNGGRDLPQTAIDTNIIGNHTITYTSTDSAGNIGTATRTVNIVDPAVAVSDIATTTATTQ